MDTQKQIVDLNEAAKGIIVKIDRMERQLREIKYHMAQYELLSRLAPTLDLAEENPKLGDERAAAALEARNLLYAENYDPRVDGLVGMYDKLVRALNDLYNVEGWH